MTTYHGQAPAKCDVCHGAITTHFSDAMLPSYGQWGNVCPGCAKSHGVRYGTGLGQCYARLESGHFVKIAG